MLNFCYSNTTLNTICNDEFYISESTNGASVLTRIWNAIKRALEKIKNFFTKSKNPDIEKLENLTPEEEQLKIEPEIDVVKTMKNIDEEIQDSEKRIKELKDQLQKTASKEERKALSKDIKSENSQLRGLKRTVNKTNRKENKIRQKELKMQRKQEDKEIRHKTRLQYKEIERGVAGTVTKVLMVPLVGVGVGVGITIFAAKRILKKIKADTDKLNAQESAIKRIINVSQGLSPEGEDVKAAEGELKTMSKITATLNQVLHEITSKIATKISQSAKEVSKKVKDGAKNKKDAIVKNAKERASSTVNDFKQHVKDIVSKTPFRKSKKKKNEKKKDASSVAETIFDEIDDI